MFDRESILKKCRKILAIQDDKGATPAEAANAAALLKRMLEKYQLSMTDIEAGLRQDGIVEVKIFFAPRLYQWQIQVHGHLASAFDCTMLMTKDGLGGKWVSYVGCASDVAVAEYYAKYFQEQLAPSWFAYKKRHGGSLIQKGSFWIAAALVVSRRLKGMRPEPKEADVPDNGARGLVLVKDGLLKAWLTEQGVKDAKPPRSEMEVDPIAFAMGKRAGQDLTLQEAVAHVG